MDFIFSKNINHQISDRCIRCYNEQYWYGENFLFDYLGPEDVKNRNILEIGCAEAGLLKFYNDKGANCSGLELSDVRFNNAVLLNKKNKIHLFQANICNPKTYNKELVQKYDLIIIRDVIEHIHDKETALINMYDILRPGGKLFISYPPKYCPYAGHQQTVPNILGKIPYLYLLPDYFYMKYLQIIGCSSKKIEYLINTKKTRISNKQMLELILRIGFNIIKKSNWFIRPAYSFRFSLPSFRNPFYFIPILNEIFCNGMLFILEKPEA